MYKEFSNKNIMEMELGSMKSGIYVVKIKAKTGIETQKLIIQ